MAYKQQKIRISVPMLYITFYGQRGHACKVHLKKACRYTSSAQGVFLYFLKTITNGRWGGKSYHKVPGLGGDCLGRRGGKSHHKVPGLGVNFKILPKEKIENF